MKYLTQLTTVVISLLLCPALQAAEVQARVTRNSVAVNESFQLILEAGEQPNDVPDLSPLNRDFEIINQRQSQSTRVINGNVSVTFSWTVTLIPRREGLLQIPSIAFGTDRSQTIGLNVKKSIDDRTSSASPDISVTMKAEPGSAYLQQQVVLTIRIHMAVNTSNASLSPPRPSDPDTIIRKLGDDRQFETLTNGRRFHVTERRYILFPQKTGTLSIEPVLFQGELLQPGSGGSRLFQSPFETFGQQRKIKRTRSDAVSIEVKPIPREYPAGAWLPTDNLRLVDDWGADEQKFRVGEPVTRTLMLMADGLAAAQLPPLEPRLPTELKLYPDRPFRQDKDSSDGVTGLLQQKIAIVPTRPGTFTLPAIAVNWWNTNTDSLETAGIPERRIQISPAATADRIERANESEKPGIQPTPESDNPLTTADSEFQYVIWLVAFLAAGWTLTAVAWWLKSRRAVRKKPPRKPASAKTRETSAPPGKRLKQACLSNDPESAGRELLTWASSHWPDSPPMSLGTLAGCFAGSEAETAIRTLERHLYSPDKGNWDGQLLWQVMEGIIAETAAKIEKQELISPLYPSS